MQASRVTVQKDSGQSHNCLTLNSWELGSINIYKVTTRSSLILTVLLVG